MAGLASLLTGQSPFAFMDKAGDITIEAQDKKGLSGVPSYVTLQFWPDSITDSKTMNYANIELPGQSNPLYHFVGGGPRNISFSTYMYRERIEEVSNSETVAGKNPQGAQYSKDIGAYVSNLRAYMSPRHNTSAGIMMPPTRLKVFFGGSKKTEMSTGLRLQGINGDNNVLDCIMTAMNVNYIKFFPNGVPRIATLDFTFEQIIQVGTEARYQDPSTFDTTERPDPEGNGFF
jgi:hypothetical protein